MSRREKEKVEVASIELIHLVFEQEGAAVLKESFALDAQFAGEVVVLGENYAVGPIQDIYLPEGWLQRKDWCMQVFNHPETESLAMVDDKMKLHQLKRALQEDPQKQLWIWMGQNATDVCGYYRLISQLIDFQGQVQVLYLNNLPFINENGSLFYPTHLSEILPKEFLKAGRLARTVTLSEFELDPEEWKKLCAENTPVRILDGGKKIISHPANYYDKQILATLGGQAMKLPRLLSALLHKTKIDLGERIIIWRIQAMIAAELVVSQGDWAKGVKHVVLKATGGKMFVQIEDEDVAEAANDVAAQ